MVEEGGTYHRFMGWLCLQYLYYLPENTKGGICLKLAKMENIHTTSHFVTYVFTPVPAFIGLCFILFIFSFVYEGFPFKFLTGSVALSEVLLPLWYFVIFLKVFMFLFVCYVQMPVLPVYANTYSIIIASFYSAMPVDIRGMDGKSLVCRPILSPWDFVFTYKRPVCFHDTKLPMCASGLIISLSFSVLRFGYLTFGNVSELL